ncbi:hypothetical protein L5515_005529 [Caenorhabditis briggsae]|uniref:Uncharacterized protein n=1 Tax=Caenorhabditis briggsae TaxID=6238 RepID=A0AAE9JDE2_CAEBR|nr:hypothetical protein L5515_005529 [Caenorhabditis briggsae]
MRFLIVLLFLPVFSLSYTVLPVPDGSEKIIKTWLDGFHLALKYGNSGIIKKYFSEDAIMYQCHRDEDLGAHWKPKLRTRDELWTYLAEHGTGIRFLLNFCEFFPNKSHIKAMLSIFGFGPPHLAPINFLLHNNQTYFGFTEYLACGLATLNRC